MVYLTPEQVAERYQVSPDTLKEWRSKGTGPEYKRFGKHVRYPLSGLEAFETAPEREGVARAP